MTQMMLSGVSTGRWALHSVLLAGAIGIAATSRSGNAADYYVNSSGDGGAYATLGLALQAAKAGPAGTASDPTRLILSPGVYDAQQILIGSNMPFLQFIGSSGNPSDTVVEYGLNAKSVIGSHTVGTTGSASVQIRADNFTAVNITFANTTPYGTAQAVALLAQGDEEAFSNDRFLGFQDTLYLKNGRSYFQNCYVTGTVDYIFGNGTAVFQNSTMSSSAPGTVTAANTNPTTGVGFVFMNSSVTSSVVPASQGGDPNDQSGVPAGSAYLGRPWDYASGSNSSVTFINTRMASVINPAGWTPWDANEVPSKTDPRYSEYGSMTSSGVALDTSQRVAWSSQLVNSGNANPLLDASNYTLSNIFGPESFWGSQYTDTYAQGGLWNPLAQIATAAVPEPTGLLLLAMAFAGLPLAGRRSRIKYYPYKDMR